MSNPEYDPEKMKEFLMQLNMDAKKGESVQKEEPHHTETTQSEEPDSGRKLSTEDYNFGIAKSKEEIEQLRQAWCNFQDSVKDLAVLEVLIADIRMTGEALAKAEQSLEDDAFKDGGPRAATRLVVRSKLLAAVLNKYRQTKGE